MAPRKQPEEIQQRLLEQVQEVLDSLTPRVRPDGTTIYLGGYVPPKRVHRNGQLYLEGNYSKVAFICPTCPRTMAKWYMPSIFPFSWYPFLQSDVRPVGDSFEMRCPKCKRPIVLSGADIYDRCCRAALAGSDRVVLTR